MAPGLSPADVGPATGDSQGLRRLAMRYNGSKMPRHGYSRPGLTRREVLMVAKNSRVERICAHCECAFTVKSSEVARGGGLYCSSACWYAFRYRPEVTQARFMAMVRVDAVSGCWIWTGATFPIKNNRGGYGKFILHGRIMSAHRAGWIIFRGPIQGKMNACHNCPGGDNRLCVRPSHLFLGTAKQNSEDMVRKGRSATGDRNGMRTHPEAYPWNRPTHKSTQCS